MQDAFSSERKKLIARYLELGWQLIPMHAPIDVHGYRCSCEVRRGKPGTCRRPGKHPMVKSWHKPRSREEIERLLDVQTVRDPHGNTVRFTPNVGLNCGASGLLAIDLDLYKGPGDHELVERILSLKTIVSCSGGGGKHVILVQPEGKKYGNSKGKLPSHVDVRGHGGCIVLPPSIHPSGRPYRFEDGKCVFLAKVESTPKWLLDLLEAEEPPRDGEPEAKPESEESYTKHSPSWRRPKVEKEESRLLEACLSPRMWRLLHTTPQVGERSTAEFGVACELARHGFSQEQVERILLAYPVGSKARSREPLYLRNTVTNAFRTVNSYPGNEKVVAAATWVVRATNEDLQSVTGRQDARLSPSARKVAVTLLTMALERGTLTIRNGVRAIALRAGLASAGTVSKALNLLDGWLVTHRERTTITLSSSFVHLVHGLCRDTDLSIPMTKATEAAEGGVGSPEGDKAIPGGLTWSPSLGGFDIDKMETNSTEVGVFGWYSSFMGTDPFTRVRSRLATMMGNTVAPFGETIQYALACLITLGGEATTGEIVRFSRRITPRAVRYSMARLAELGIVSVERSGRSNLYALAPDWPTRLTRAAERMTSYGANEELRERFMLEQQRYLDMVCGYGPRHIRERRRKILWWVKQHRAENLMAISPHMQPHEVLDLVYNDDIIPRNDPIRIKAGMWRRVCRGAAVPIPVLVRHLTAQPIAVL